MAQQPDQVGVPKALQGLHLGLEHLFQSSPLAGRSELVEPLVEDLHGHVLPGQEALVDGAEATLPQLKSGRGRLKGPDAQWAIGCFLGRPGTRSWLEALQDGTLQVLVSDLGYTSHPAPAA